MGFGFAHGDEPVGSDLMSAVLASLAQTQDGRNSLIANHAKRLVLKLSRRSTPRTCVHQGEYLQRYTVSPSPKSRFYGHFLAHDNSVTAVFAVTQASKWRWCIGSPPSRKLAPNNRHLAENGPVVACMGSPYQPR